MMSVWEKRGGETDEQRISVRFVFFQGYTWDCLLLCQQCYCLRAHTIIALLPFVFHIL
jgi:hypothetical protein